MAAVDDADASGASPGGPSLRRDDVDEVRRALAAGEMGTWHWDAVADEVAWNDELAAVFGVAPGDFPGPRHATERYVHPDDQAHAGAMTQQAIENRSSARFEYRIVRPDGEVRWVETRAQVLAGPAGELLGARGVTFDITERKTLELERDRLQERLALLAEVTTTLAASLHVQEVLEKLAGLVVPRLCDAVLVRCVADPGLPRRALVRAVDPEVQEQLEAADRVEPARQDGRNAANQAFASGQAVLVEDVDEAYIRSCVSPDAVEHFLKAGITSAVVAPFLARGGVLGVLVLFATERSGRRYDEQDRTLAGEIGRRAGLALDNARLYAVERNVAETLQRALLPRLPTTTGVEVAARYLPSGGPAQEVGGDWFDVFEVPGGELGFTVGDVAGHDLRAAAAMAQARSALRAYARDGAPPAVVLDRLAAYVDDFAVAELVTVGYGLLRRCAARGGGGRLQWASAGHLPPLLIRADGRTSYVEAAASPPLGAPAAGLRGHAELDLAPGDTVFCFTDGLVERREADLDEGLGRLADAAERHHLLRLDELCDALLEELGGGVAKDDVAVLALRLVAA